MSSEFSTPVVFALGGVTAALALRSLYRWWSGGNSSGYPYPPGPKGYPLIQNILDVPVDRPWEGYTELSRKYGDMVFLRVFNQPILVLSSQRRVEDLLEKRSTIYSGRPHSIMMNDMLRFDNFFTVMDYGPGWRKHRKLFHEHFQASVTSKYHPIVEKYTHRLLTLLLDGSRVEDATRNAIAGQGIQILFGVDVKSVEDPFVADYLKVADAFEAAGVPGKFLVEMLPFLQHVPAWVPGAGFRRWADEHREASLRVLNNPFNFVWNAYRTSKAVPCVATAMIENFSEDEALREEESTVARNTLAMSHLAAVDTTHSSVMTFFQAMLINPHVQKKAREELDRVIGVNVLPTISQIHELPYINAIIKEVLRTIQVLPLAIPHLVAEDNIYDGYFIPKGTMVIGNCWGMMHDPDVFEDPMAFKPERYLTKDGKLNPDAVEPMAGFGFGRRMCPGRFLAVEMLFSVIASTLAVYDIVPAKDENGNPIELKEARFVGGALMQPEPFECVFQPRSERAREIIQDLKHSV